jgi:hypothetical protein
MSVQSMTELASGARLPAPQAVPPTSGEPASTGSSNGVATSAGADTGASGLRLIATYIPSEAIATYLFLLGLLVPVSGTPAEQVTTVKLIAFSGGLLLAGALVPFTFNRQGLDRRETIRRQLILIGLAMLGFFAYSLATPGGPWEGQYLGISVTVWGAALVAVLAIVLPRLASTLRVRPS